MDRRQHIAWGDLTSLRIVQRFRELIWEHWGLGLRFTDGEGLQQGASPDRLVSAGLCPLLRQLPADRPCSEAAGAAMALLEASADHGSQLITTCIFGLAQAAAPIRLDNELQGAVLSDGFWDGSPPDEPTLRLLADAAALPWETALAAARTTPALSKTEQSHLLELIAPIANEVVAFQLEIGRPDRRRPPEERNPRYAYDFIIGESRPMRELYRLLDKVIASDSTVLIYGENGTGKELIAKAIHFNSSRKHKRFVVQNCSAFNDNLLDSELFGHKRGSFTGAVSDKQGLFEIADGSTFFLDEIGDMSPSLQVKLLRVLQEGTFIPVGDTQPKQVDVRIIAATNRDLKKMVERSEFREDLYYRINVIGLTVPPLRDRQHDISLLVHYFLSKQARGDLGRTKKLSKACLDQLMSYSWPGNVRELENEIERLVVLADEEKLITEDLLSARFRQLKQPGRLTSGAPRSLPAAVDSLERTMIYEALKRNHWNKSHAAQELQISRRNLIRKVSKYQLDQRKLKTR